MVSYMNSLFSNQCPSSKLATNYVSLILLKFSELALKFSASELEVCHCEIDQTLCFGLGFGLALTSMRRCKLTELVQYCNGLLNWWLMYIILETGVCSSCRWC